jgi:hypothetical protein
MYQNNKNMTSLYASMMSEKDLFNKFKKACIDGNLETAKCMRQSMRGPCDINYIFSLVCGSGYLDVVQWLYSLNPEMDIKDGFSSACAYGHFDVAQWIYSLNPEMDIQSGFSSACFSERFEVLEWLYSLEKEINVEFDFVCSCQHGHLDVAQWLYSLDPEMDVTNGFNIACKNGRLDVVQWLYMLDPEMDIEYGFERACRYGLFDIVKLLYMLNPEMDIKKGFEEACEYRDPDRNLGVIQWLYMHKPDMDITANYILYTLCVNLFNEFNLPALRWLYGVRPEISEEFNNIFSIACKQNTLKVARWCYERKNEVLNNAAFIEACYNRSRSVVEWIHDLQPERYQFTINASGDIEPVVNMIFPEKRISEITQCVVCYEDTSNVITSCNHQYCSTCIQEWMKRERCCAYCRKSLVVYIDLFKIVRE